MKNKIIKTAILSLMAISVLCIIGCNRRENDSTTISSGQTSSTNTLSETISSELPIVQEGDFPTLAEMFDEITKTQRKCGTNGEKRAKEYISNQMKSFGFNVEVQTFDVFDAAMKNVYKKDVYFDFDAHGQSPLAQGSNIIANLNHDKSKKTMIFSAHYDTTADSIGALDNGSGTAVLMEAAKLIREQQLDYNIRIIFFSGEENGLYGSRYYVGSLPDEELSNIIGCFNIDVVGAKDCREILMQTYQIGNKGQVEENWITKEFGRINGEYTLMYGSSSDHAPFIHKGIPAIQLATVDPREETFDKSLLYKEENTNSVSLDNLQKDVALIYEFMKQVDNCSDIK